MKILAQSEVWSIFALSVKNNYSLCLQYLQSLNNLLLGGFLSDVHLFVNVWLYPVDSRSLFILSDICFQQFPNKLFNLVDLSSCWRCFSCHYDVHINQTGCRISSSLLGGKFNQWDCFVDIFLFNHARKSHLSKGFTDPD